MRTFIGTLVLLLAAGPVLADPPAINLNAAGPVVRVRAAAKTLVVDATPVSKPALRYRLLPAVTDQEPGNAAAGYYRAMLPEVFHHRRMEKIDEKMESWRTTPLAELPRQEMAWLLTYRPLLDSDQAARRETCDWELLARLKAEGAATLLPEIQTLRELARLNALRTRLYLMDRDYANAARSLETGMALGRQVGEQPVLISGLVGVACTSMALLQVEEWIQTSQAPNLYWALTVLPQPCISFRRALEGERLFLTATIAAEAPEVLTAHQRVFTSDEAQKVLRRLRDVLTMAEAVETVEGKKPDEFGLKEAAAALVLGAAIAALEDESRAGLLAVGHDAAQVKAMPAVQAVLLHAINQYNGLQDDLLSFSSLPYWQAAPRLKEFEQNLAARQKRRSVLPIEALIPAVSKAYFATVRLDRQIAALRNVEALRLYAATHDGKFPEKLADLTETPAAIDPVTGQAFDYQVVDGKATLRGPAPEGEVPTESNSIHYEIVLRGLAPK